MVRLYTMAEYRVRKAILSALLEREKTVTPSQSFTLQQDFFYLCVMHLVLVPKSPQPCLKPTLTQVTEQPDSFKIESTGLKLIITATTITRIKSVAYTMME